MTHFKARIWILLVMQSWVPAQAASPLQRLTRVDVSRALAATPGRYSTLGIPPGASYVLRCSSGCVALLWCRLWCHDSPADACIFSDIVVMPEYDETSTADVIPCYTMRQKSYMNQAVIESSQEWISNHPGRLKENLMDKSYVTGDLNTCLLLEGVTFPWFLLDFGEPVTFQHVRIIAQTGSNVYTFCDVEVRVGISPVSTPGDFSSYKLLGKFAGPATENQDVDFKTAKPVTARFVSVQKMKQDWFQPCHVEVY